MNLRERLREETRAEHQATESLLGDLLSPELDRERYVEILRSFWAIHSDVEEFLKAESCGEANRYFASHFHSRLGALEADLAELQATPPSSRGECGSLSEVAGSEAEVWGLLYVIEGSALGGQMIARHLETRFGGEGLHFFEGRGAETGAHWRRFLAALENPATRANADATVEAARRTFTWMGQRLAPTAKI